MVKHFVDTVMKHFYYSPDLKLEDLTTLPWNCMLAQVAESCSTIPNKSSMVH